MTIKSLLLGSAAAVAVVGGAQAADLSVAEPVEYVKVCDYFGTGYWYIPGTDTCIKISGYVQEGAEFHANQSMFLSHSAGWSFNNVLQMDVDTKSETEYGVLEGLISFGGGSNHATNGYGTTTLGDDGAYLALGGFKAGAYQNAAWAPTYAVTDNHGTANAELYSTFGYAAMDTVQMSWAAGGVSMSIAASDPSTALGALLPLNYSMPLITGNIGFTAGSASVVVAGGFTQLAAGSSWGIDAVARFNLGKEDSIELNGAYGDEEYITNTGFGTPGANNGYSFLAAWQHNLSKTLALQLVGSWAQYSGTGFGTGYALNADLVWTPVTNLAVTGAIDYTHNTTTTDGNGAWLASITARKSW